MPHFFYFLAFLALFQHFVIFFVGEGVKCAQSILKLEKTKNSLFLKGIRVVCTKFQVSS